MKKFILLAILLTSFVVVSAKTPGERIAKTSVNSIEKVNKTNHNSLDKRNKDWFKTIEKMQKTENPQKYDKIGDKFIERDVKNRDKAIEKVNKTYDKADKKIDKIEN